MCQLFVNSSCELADHSYCQPIPIAATGFLKRDPPGIRSLVVVPSMLLNTQNIENLAEALEVRFLANQDENLHFGLLTDFKDAAQEVLEEDDQLIQTG